jgi:hypothetical protein
VDFDKNDKDGNVVVFVDEAKYEPTTDEDRLISSALVRGNGSAFYDVSNMARLSTNVLIAADGTAKL